MDMSPKFIIPTMLEFIFGAFFKPPLFQF